MNLVRILIEANSTALNDLKRLVDCFSEDQYASMSIEGVSAPGKHVRHITDHYEAFSCGLETGVIDYDMRSRASAQEKCQMNTALTINRIQTDILESSLSDKTLKLSSTVTESATQPYKLVTSVRRELVYLLNHTIHHTAMISLLARLHGVCDIPAGGVAPSTRRWEKAQMDKLTTTAEKAHAVQN